MVTYDLVEYWLEVPKLIEFFMFVILGIQIYRMKDYIVNKIFGISLMTWSIYTLADLIMWITAANSETWLMIDNIIRDIQLTAAIVFAFLIYVNSQIIANGTQGLNKKKIYSVLGIFLAILIVMITIESLVIQDIDGNILLPSEWETAPLVIVSTNLSLLFMILMALPLVLYAVSIRTLVKTMAKMKDEKVKKRMRYLIIGIVLIPIGTVYFAIVLSLNLAKYALIVYTTGRLFWSVSPILIQLSQRKS